MNEPRAEQIAAATVDALKGISIGGGYYTDLGIGARVTRRRWDPIKVPTVTLPVASVWMGEWKRGEGYCLGSVFGRVLRLLAVDIWTHSDDPADVDRDGLRAEADVVRAVLSTGNLGLSFVTTLELSKGMSDHQEFGDRGIGLRVVGFAVDYTETASGPGL